MDTFRGSFFKDSLSQSQSQSQSQKMIETSEKKEEKNEDSGFKNKFGRYLVPRKWLMPSSLWSREEKEEVSDQQPLQGRRPPRHRAQDTTDQQPGQECSNYDEVKRWIFMTEVELKIFLH